MADIDEIKKLLTRDIEYIQLADYDRYSQELIIADTNPKKYTRFWRSPARRMYSACTDKDESAARARGMINHIRFGIWSFSL